ncbi:DUF6527 family protein [Acidicapsa acidisoli]|uniref:DUF6527 family protein n=1 Tax=Acidicapsa acidisoli TaxID=1615681 RepID=UPI0037C05FFC
MIWLLNLWRRLRRRFSRAEPGVISSLPAREEPSYCLVFVEDMPDELTPYRLYVAGEAGNYWAAALICPCGCEAVIRLNLLRQVRPCWKTQEHDDGTVSLSPSVWRQHGCRSHFFLRHGKIEWC